MKVMIWLRNNATIHIFNETRDFPMDSNQVTYAYWYWQQK